MVSNVICLLRIRTRALSLSLPLSLTLSPLATELCANLFMKLWNIREIA